ncbi:type II toxin-antitoxin system HigB family toxin [Litoribacter alkaliphilus]|uniref:Type II toxin-antitoxin system HigB family toxin n=1 Tax=Litoribacter ruber TaxID=702568 RepID=A0AAP2G4U8_9BACT|nr:type II toxin-antitoxin system HigB family toxin [Litoribacter alkaliphilus]MBS9524391.1 type II toxin-antitoxin system HigB family toxin [Litoribacter alkaliphilus]
MKVISKKPLKEFWLKNPETESQLKSWFKEVSKATWESPADIKQDYTKASILKGGRVVFNICGNRYRLIVEINFMRQWVFIRFIGTHKDYDKLDAQTI